LSAVERGRVAWSKGDYEAASAYFEQYLKESPAGPDAEEITFQLGDVYYHKLKRFDRARDCYAALLNGYPASSHRYEARHRLAEVYLELHDIPEAITNLERLILEHPDTPAKRKIRMMIADLYFDIKNFSQAEQEYNRVIIAGEYDELTEHSLLRIASIYHMMRERHELALALYDRVARSTGDMAVRRRALYSLSDAYAELFRFEEAIATLGRIDDPAEADYIARRTEELERQRQAHAAAPDVDWASGKGD
jgi:TolA-binding protein